MGEFSYYILVSICINCLYDFSFDCNDEEAQSDGDDDEEVNGNDSEEEGVYFERVSQIKAHRRYQKGTFPTILMLIVRLLS